jgi:hypothetical protein
MNGPIPDAAHVERLLARIRKDAPCAEPTP